MLVRVCLKSYIYRRSRNNKTNGFLKIFRPVGTARSGEGKEYAAVGNDGQRSGKERYGRGWWGKENKKNNTPRLSCLELLSALCSPRAAAVTTSLEYVILVNARPSAERARDSIINTSIVHCIQMRQFFLSRVSIIYILVSYMYMLHACARGFHVYLVCMFTRTNNWN